MRKTIIAKETIMLLLKVLFPGICPTCESPSGTVGCDYSCPECRSRFCSQCYRTDQEGDGTYVFCPHCKTKLFFPEFPGRCLEPEFVVTDICVFTNKGSSGVKSNDGRECRILRVKEPGMWVNPAVPEYVIGFDDDHGFGASERELVLVRKQQTKGKT